MSSQKTVHSFCRICTSLCGIRVETDGEEVVRVSGDPDHPQSKGYTCAKGRALPRMHHHPQRLEYPQVRGKRCSWDSALDNLASELKRIIDNHGPGAVGIYFGSGVGMDAAGYKMAEALHAAIGTPAKFSPLTIDGTAKVLVSSLMAHFPGFNARPDYSAATFVLYIGINPVVSHGHATATPLPPPIAVKNVSERGDVWVVDPRRNETARFGTRHLAPIPGTDYAVLGYLLRETLAGDIAPAVLARVQQLDELRNAVAAFDCDSAASLTDLPAQALRELLETLRRHKRIAIDTGTGVTMSSTANVTQWFAWALMILTDSINRPGGIWFHPGFITPLDAEPLPEIPPEILFGPGPKSRPELQGFLGEWPCAALPDEIEAGNIRAFLNLGGNLLTAFPDENRLKPALQKLEVFASLDIIANETTALSSHILPTKDQLERADITLWDILSSRVSAQYTPPVIEPSGERRSTWWILAQLIQRLGGNAGDGLPENDTRNDDEFMLARTMENARCRFDELQDTGYRDSEHLLPARWVENFISSVGGWRLAPLALLEQLEHLANAETPTGLRLIPRRQSRHVNAQLSFLGDKPEVLLNPLDAGERSISPGQRVAVRNGLGEFYGVAKISDEVRTGVVSVPHGFENANVNQLTDAGIADPITGMARYSGFSVNVEPA